MPAHPRTIHDISAAWIDEILHAAGALSESLVLAVEAQQIGEGVGYLSCVARVRLTYDRLEPRAPQSVIVKLDTQNEVFHRIGQELHAFEREIRFYREVAGRLPLRLPKVYYTQPEPPDYAIVMEDLSHCVPGDQLAGMQERQVLATARIIARLQARYWNNEALKELDWMPETWALWTHYVDHWPSFVEHCRQWMGPEQMLLGRRVAEHFQWIVDEMNAAPRTIVHCDLREDNLLFGPVGSPDEVLIVDWQLAIRNMGAYDIASLQGGSELAAERRGHSFAVLKAWHETLVAEGVRGYSYDEALRHFRLANLVCLSLPVYFHLAAIKGGQARAPKLAEAQTRRHFGAALEIDAGSVLPS